MIRLSLQGRQFVRIIVLMMGVFVLFGACQNTKRHIDQEELFFLELGKLENTINLFHDEGTAFSERSDITMVDGLVYILNRNSNKIMVYTSYGDLISLLYDPDENPAPLSVLQEGEDGSISSRRAVPFAFTRIGWFAVDSQRRLLVEDRLPRDRWEQDVELDSMLNRVVLRFTPDGQLLDYIGQDGPRGAPFPYIYRVEATDNDELVVISRVPEKWLVYWFLPSGEHVTSLEIPVDQLPIPEEGLVPSLQEIFPDPELRRLYLKIDYYQTRRDENTGGIRQVTLDSSSIYWLDLEDGVYRDSIVIPPNRQFATGSSLFEEGQREYSYSLLGVPGKELLLLMSEEPEGQVQLMLMKTDGTVIRRRYIEIPRDGILRRRLRIGENGILVGLLSYEDGASVYWWRTDAMLPFSP